MVDTKTVKPDMTKLVKMHPVVRRSKGHGRAPRLKRAKAHVRAHKVRGNTYYSYCRGTDKEIYLGSADFILEAVRAAREIENQRVIMTV